MIRKKTINIIIFAGAMIALAVVCRQLYFLRFRGSDIYPQFSSFRSDPFGCKVLFESLARLESVKVTRNLRPLEEMKSPSGSCLLVIGAGRRIFRKNRDLLKFAMNGGRVVVFYSPFQMKSVYTPQKPPPFMFGKPQRELLLPGSVLKRHHLPPAFPVQANPLKIVSQHKLPKIDFYSSWYFHPQHKDWQALFTVLDKPVLIKRRYGSGELVLCSDSFLMSNEAMAGKPSGKLILYLLGGRKQVFFEETHLGSYESRNITWLISRYNLIWVLLALGVTVGLFVWRSLLTPSDSDRPISKIPDVAIDNDSLAAPAGLFQQDFPARELPGLCLDEFLKSGKGKRLSQTKRELMKAASKHQRPLEAYNLCVNEYKKKESFKEFTVHSLQSTAGSDKDVQDQERMAEK
jgi:Domain of unknown function (DUF4350)